MIRITVEAAIENNQLEEFLTLIRNFDRSHPNGLFRMTSMGGDMKMDEIKAMLTRLGLPILYAERMQ
jgi:hypothetical protein